MEFSESACGSRSRAQSGDAVKGEEPALLRVSRDNSQGKSTKTERALGRQRGQVLHQTMLQLLCAAVASLALSMSPLSTGCPDRAAGPRLATGCAMQAAGSYNSWQHLPQPLLNSLSLLKKPRDPLTFPSWKRQCRVTGQGDISAT